METLDLLAHGFAVALSPYNLLWAAIGVTLGTAIGVLPGIGPSTTVALLLPMTFGMAPISAFIMFAGIYYGAQYGGSTAAILLNTPGEAGAMMTTLDGNAMARRGRGAQALATAAIGSFVAGTIGTIGLPSSRGRWSKSPSARSAGIFRPHGARLCQRTGVFGDSRCAACVACFFGLLLGAVRPRAATGRRDLPSASWSCSMAPTR